MKRYISIIAMAMVSLLAVSCFGIDEQDYKELAPITFNEVSSVIDVDLGQELVYEKLQVNSELPVEYQWAYGPKKISAAKDEYEMDSMEIISSDPQIRYTFKKLGQFVLRLRVDNGESIEYKNFTLTLVLMRVSASLTQMLRAILLLLSSRSVLRTRLRQTSRKSGRMYSRLSTLISL